MKKENSKYTKLLNFAQGKYSYKEYRKIKEWLNEAEDNDKIRDLFFQHWKDIHLRGDKNPESLEHVFQKISSAVGKKQEKKRWNGWHLYRQIAAILLIPLASFALWHFLTIKNDQTLKGWVEINAPEGSRVHFTLPDNSTGWLNGGSKMKYSANFKDRQVELTGEAFFDVEHLDESDFTVDVGNMAVKVLGTKFNVSAYPNDSFKEVVLQEGRVEITDSLRNYNEILLPNQKIRFDRQISKYQIKSVEADRYNAWTKGYLIIDNEPLASIIKKLERRYNAEITISDDILKTYHFKATFYDEPLEEVLRLISITTPITYSIETRNINSLGILKQKKVMIKPK